MAHAYDNRRADQDAGARAENKLESALKEKQFAEAVRANFEGRALDFMFKKITRRDNTPTDGG